MNHTLLTPRQLIYTNVEAVDSPNRERGFQVWQWSKALSPEHRKLIAKRVGDFQLPPGTSASDTEICRYISCSPEKNVHLIARSVPLKEKDKFGRGGKFFAHAIVLTDEDFAGLAYNPFPLIDGGFPFAEKVDTIKDLNADWKKGELADVPIDFISLTADQPKPPEESKLDKVCIQKLLGHFENEDDRPIVFPHKPKDVLSVLRYLFLLLPISVRQKMYFDTLSNGSALNQNKYALVGSYSADAMKIWSFRRYVKLDLSKGEFTPKLDAMLLQPQHSLIFEPEWGSLTENDRKALYEETRKLIKLELKDLEPERLTSSAQIVFDKSEEIGRAIRLAKETRIAMDMPVAFNTLPRVWQRVDEWLAGSSFQILGRLKQPIPPDLIDDAVATALEGQIKAPAAEVLLALGERVPQTENQKLKWIYRRWRGTEEDIQTLEEQIASGENETMWLSQWIPQTLPAEFRGSNRIDNLLDILEQAKSLKADKLRDARLMLACDIDLENSQWVKAKLGVALCAGETQFHRAFQELSHLIEVEEWLFEQTIKSVAKKWVAGWTVQKGSKPKLGIFLIPSGERKTVVAEACRRLEDTRFAKKLFKRLWSNESVENYPSTANNNFYSIALDPSKEVDAAFSRLYTAGPKEVPRATDELRELLRKTKNESYRYVAGKLLETILSSWAWIEVDDPHDSDSAIYFVGLLLETNNSLKSDNWQQLFAALAGASVPEVELRKLSAEGFGKQLASRDERRFSWLMSRMANPISTANLELAD